MPSENPFPATSPLNEIWTTLTARPDVPPLLPRRPYNADIADRLKSLSDIDRPNPNLLAALHLMNDDLESAHVLVQDGANATACYLHMIVHRREGDWGNAKYWVGRTGEHPFYQEAARLAGTSTWDARAMVDRCQRGSKGGGSSPDAEAAARLAALETEELAVWLSRDGAA